MATWQIVLTVIGIILVSWLIFRILRFLFENFFISRIFCFLFTALDLASGLILWRGNPNAEEAELFSIMLFVCAVLSWMFFWGPGSFDDMVVDAEYDKAEKAWVPVIGSSFLGRGILFSIGLFIYFSCCDRLLGGHPITLFLPALLILALNIFITVRRFREFIHRIFH